MKLKIKEDIVIYTAIEILEDRLKKNTFEIKNAIDTKKFITLKLAEKPHELFSVLFLDNKHRLIEFIELFRGTIDGCSVYTREIVSLAIQHNAAAIVVAHNHPSGEPEPSQADIKITNKLKESLKLIDVRVLDHIIVGNTSTVSFAERGLL